MPNETDVADLLSRLETPSTPSDAFASRLRERIGGELAMESPASTASSPHVVSLPASTTPGALRRLPARRVRTALPALGAAACVLSIAAFYVMVVSQVAPPARTGSTDTGYELYTVAGDLTQIDPTTLADLDDQPNQSSFDALPSPIATSADGSLIAVVEPVEEPDRTTYLIAVIEARAGEERVTIPWKYPIESLDFNTDGSRLVVGTLAGTMELGPGWHIYDARTGKLVWNIASANSLASSIALSADGSRLVFETAAGTGELTRGWRVYDLNTGDAIGNTARRANVDSIRGGAFETWIDAEATTLYRLILGDPDMVGVAADQTYLRADDLLTGRLIGRVGLPNLASVAEANSSQIHFDGFPSVAMSPDRSKLAMIHADADHLTIVNLNPLTIEQTVDLKRSSSRVDSALAWLGIKPTVASAKVFYEGEFRLVFAPDGDHVYAWDASPLGMSPEGIQLETHQRGLQVIDLETGTIRHEAFADTQILDVVPAPDGDALFVTVATGYDDRGNPNAYALWRLDSDLNRTAERPFTIEPHVVIASP